MWTTSAFSDSTRARVGRRPGEKDHLRLLSRGRLAAAQQLVQAVVIHRNVQQRVHALQALLPRRHLHPGLHQMRSLSLCYCIDGSVTRAMKYACMHLEALALEQTGAPERLDPSSSRARWQWRAAPLLKAGSPALAALQCKATCQPVSATQTCTGVGSEGKVHWLTACWSDKFLSACSCPSEQHPTPAVADRLQTAGNASQIGAYYRIRQTPLVLHR